VKTEATGSSQMLVPTYLPDYMASSLKINMGRKWDMEDNIVTRIRDT